jgi:hypothetical protein
LKNKKRRMAISWSVKCLCTAEPCYSAIVVRVFKFIRDRGGNTERETGKESKKEEEEKATWTQFRIFR